MAITSVLAVGLAAQSIFIGGNVFVSSIFIPIVRHSDVPPKLQLSQWEKMYDKASKLMASSAVVTFACYAYEAYQAAAGSDTRNVFIRSAISSILVIPFTIGVIFPTIKKLKGFKALKTDAELADKDVSYWIGHWNQLSIVRFLIFSVGFVNALAFYVRN